MPARPDPKYLEATKMALEQDAADLASLGPLEPPPPAAPVSSAADRAPALQTNAEAWKPGLDDLFKGLGSPTDPVERMLAEQLALAHHAVGRLLACGASRAADPEVTACHASAARLMAEFRRTALALMAYRGLRAGPRHGGTGAPPGQRA